MDEESLFNSKPRFQREKQLANSKQHHSLHPLQDRQKLNGQGFCMFG